MPSLDPGWRRVKFGEVVRLNKESCKDPTAEGIARYVGLEHIEPDDLRLRSWGDVASGITFTNRVRPGQVLFGKRRAYQRKVAVADFDAVCSGDIYVLECAKPEWLLPGLLPFVCQTDTFFEHAVGTSAGSLSPRTNWTSLAGYEFVLPPMEDQLRWARELAAVEKALADARSAASKGVEFLEVMTWNLVTGKRATGPRVSVSEWVHGRLPGVNAIPASWRITQLTKVARLESGHTPSRRHPEYWAGGIPWISLGDIQRLGTTRIDATDEEIGPLGIENSSARLLPAGTVVLSRDASVGFTSVMGRPMATSQHFACFVCSDALSPQFLFHLFTGMKEYWDYIAVGSTNVKTIYMPFFRNLQIALPPRAAQEEIVGELESLGAAVAGIRRRVAEHSEFLRTVRETRLRGRT
jgi:type I restriction enzyme, S subunit